MSEGNSLNGAQISTTDNNKLVRPKVQLQSLLKLAGATKDVFTVKEVIYYLGQYIMGKQLYDKQQQHLVHCADDPLGSVLGVDSFSVKEPRVLFEMISKNLIVVKNQESQTSEGLEKTDSDCQSSTSGQRRRRNSDSVSSCSSDRNDRRKRHKSDSISLTFDDSLSWCVIGGLRRDRDSSDSSDSHSDSEIGIYENCKYDESHNHDSDADNFSVEFEVESNTSAAYSENDEASVESREDEVYEVTIFGADDEDSFDEDPEISEARAPFNVMYEDYWKCSKCEELNPPLPRHCNRCWTLRPDWFPDTEPTAESRSLPTKAPAAEEGLDVPDGRRCQKEPTSQPSTSSQEEVPELERYSSLEACLPPSCLEPCVICQSRPKNGCIVHGRTGHLMACYTCAKKLKNRNKLCPVCREPIQSVVLTYLS